MAQNNPSETALTTAQSPPPTNGTVDDTAPYKFNDQGGPTRLAWANDLTGATAYRSRVTRPPKQLGTSDPTIARVKARQETYIYEMVQAMFKVDTVKDNPTFEGVFWFTRGHKNVVSAYDVEAACRVLFKAVLDRCEIGHRGLDREDRLYKKYPEKIDLNGSCEARINNVITALCEWKSICKDVLTSDAKIGQLANAPASIAKDKQKHWKNNKTKKESTQNDRVVAVTATQGAAAAALVVAGNLPPVARVGRQKKTKPEKKNREDRDPSAPPPRTQAGSSSSKPSYTDRANKQCTAHLSEPDPLAGFDLESSDLSGHLQQPAGPGSLPQDPPVYGCTYPVGISQQGQSLVHQQGRLFASQPNQPFVPPQHQAIPSAYPKYNSGGFGATRQVFHSFSGYVQGLVPVNLSNHFNGPTYAPKFPLSSPHGNPTTNMRSYNMYGTITPPKTPAYGGTSTTDTIYAAAAAAVPSQPSRPLNPAAKHYRTPTMDAQSQPLPTRVKRDEVQEDVTSGLDNVDEE
ncbi:hypothetical protein BU25DRAFT_459038 [Macroventuria anomochaeta]|uniref:Uncharacterized protein n=1 Tax=Macroventuria anomochaeta TaxID=301207 RepID=A0ACB6S034_9PLEO|nr:uncharacterized protein BU25DRAFT_459038 [Macroventuria anomochaeta]KAF2626759.1 hypothetical protein BU25DRAFT_459038 [Macroventuria anomochaeta]